MSLIFIGLILAFLDISIGGMSITPSFLGYALIAAGLRGELLKRPSAAGEAARKAASVSTIAGGILWLLGFFRLWLPFPVGTVFQLLVTWFLLRWASELSGGGWSGKMKLGWDALAAGVAVTWAGVFWHVLSWVGLIASLCAAAYYLYGFYQVWKEQERGG